MVGTMSHATACASLVLARRKTAVCWRVVRACSLEHCVDLMANIISFCNVLLRPERQILSAKSAVLWCRRLASLTCCATQSTTTGLANSCVMMPSRDPNNRLTRSHLACVSHEGEALLFQVIELTPSLFACVRRPPFRWPEGHQLL